MVAPRHLTIKDGDSLRSVGSLRGAFVLRGRGSSWERGGPHFARHAVRAMAYDGRAGRRRLGAGPESAHRGAVLRSSDDFGQTLSRSEVANVCFPDDPGPALQKIGQICPRIRSRRAARRS